MKPSSFTGSVVSAIDCFLNVAPSFFQYFPDFQSNVGGESIFVGNKDLAKTEKQFCASWRRGMAPAIECLLRGIDRGIDVVAGRERKPAYDVEIVRGIEVLKHLARLAGNPFSADIILLGF